MIHLRCKDTHIYIIVNVRLSHILFLMYHLDELHCKKARIRFGQHIFFRTFAHELKVQKL